MRVQDEERRKIARELHDSLGQYLAATKMQLDSLACHVPAEHHEALVTAQECVERSLSETRTLSYLLHPPLLDESGLESAIRWYVEGFAQRSVLRIPIVRRPSAAREALGLSPLVKAGVADAPAPAGTNGTRSTLVNYDLGHFGRVACAPVIAQLCCRGVIQVTDKKSPGVVKEVNPACGLARTHPV